MRRVLATFVVISLCVSIVNIAPLHAWWHELGVTFGNYLFALHLCALSLLAVAFAFRRPILSGRTGLLVAELHAACAAWYLSFILPLYAAPHAAPPDAGQPVRIIYASLEGAESAAALARDAADFDADILATGGVSPEVSAAAAPPQQFPFRFETPAGPRGPAVVYSKFPLDTASGRAEMGEEWGGQIVVTVHLPRQDAVLAVMRAEAPLCEASVRANRILARRFSSTLRWLDGPVLAMGTLQGEIYSESYDRFVSGAFMRDAARGLGLLRTWPDGALVARFALDHIFYKGPVSVRSFRVLPSIGTTHLPLAVELSIAGARDRTE